MAALYWLSEVRTLIPNVPTGNLKIVIENELRQNGFSDVHR